MKYMGMPMGMWVLFAGSFQKHLTAVLGYDADAAKAITKKAKPKYKAIIADLPEFEKADRFKMNIVNCAMLGAFILSMPLFCELDEVMITLQHGVLHRKQTLANGGEYCDYFITGNRE